MKPIIGRAVALTALVAVSGPALANTCPTLDDLKTGIRITYADNFEETYKLSEANEHIVTVEEIFDNTDVSHSLLAQGIYLVQSIQEENGALAPSTRITYTYPLSPGNMPVPQPNGSWNAKIAVLSNDGLTTETHQMRFLERTSLTVGACSYDMVPIRVTYGQGEGETLYYMPELGFAVIGVWTSNGEDDVYEFTSIEVAQ